MGALALFLVLAGGTAYAANTIGSADVIDESLTADDLAAGSVGTSEVGFGVLTAADLGTGSVGASELDIHIEKVVNSSTDSTYSKTITAWCPPGYTVLNGGGGFSTNSGGDGKITITNSGPNGATGWTVSAQLISFPYEKTNWYHRHTGDSVYDVAWKDWIWKNSADHKGDWTLNARAVCAEL